MKNIFYLNNNIEMIKKTIISYNLLNKPKYETRHKQ